MLDSCRPNSLAQILDTNHNTPFISDIGCTFKKKKKNRLQLGNFVTVTNITHTQLHVPA